MARHKASQLVTANMAGWPNRLFLAEPLVGQSMKPGELQARPTGTHLTAKPTLSKSRDQ